MASPDFSDIRAQGSDKRVLLDPLTRREKILLELPDFSDIRAHESVKRAMLVSLAGKHNILMVGPSGCGKTMLAKAAKAAKGLFAREKCAVDIVDFNRLPKPTRWKAHGFTVAESWPCPCGWSSDPRRACRCSERTIHAWMSRLSFAMRYFDLHIEVVPVPIDAIMDQRAGGTSTSILTKRLEAATVLPKPRPWELTTDCQRMIKQAVSELGLSIRSVDTVCALSATIAGLDGEEKIRLSHVAEALQYRKFDRM